MNLRDYTDPEYGSPAYSYRDRTPADLAARESQDARNASPIADMTAAEFAREERGE